MTVEFEFELPYSVQAGQWQVDLAEEIVTNTAVTGTTGLEREIRGTTFIVRLSDRDTVTPGDETTIRNRVTNFLGDAIHRETRENV